MRSDPAGSPNQEPQEKKRWVEPVTALLMALATLSTAWCSYHSAAWTRKSNRLMNEFNSLERRAGLQTMQGMQQATIHVAMFMELLAAQQAGNERLADFYAERFPPDVRKAYDANAKAASSLQASRSAGNVSGQYLANTVLFATVLFFASASGKFEQRRVRVVAFAFAVAVFLFAIVQTAMLPR